VHVLLLDQTSAQYWPTDANSAVEHGALRVTLTHEDNEQFPNIIIRDLNISPLSVTMASMQSKINLIFLS
jgi:hypothetical protein